MPVEIRILPAASVADGGADLRVVLDSPRLVFGRGKSCDVPLFDRTVSARHASIRQRGAEHLLFDEGSTNGTRVGRVRLPPQTPRVLRHGDTFRIGRVWLQIGLVAGVADGPGEGLAMGLRHLQRTVSAAGEPTAPRVTVVEGPDEGLELELTDPEEEYVIGRGKDADLTLGDANVSRRHVTVRLQGAKVLLRDQGSTRGSRLDDEPLPPEDTPWRPGEELVIGDDRLALSLPLDELLAEIAAAPDERMHPREHAEPGPHDSEAEPVVEAPAEPMSGQPVEPEEPEPGEPFDDLLPASEEDLTEASRPYRVFDVLVVLVALGMIGLSVAGLMWIFGG